MDEYVRFSKAMKIPQQLEQINSDNLKYNFRGRAEVDEYIKIEEIKSELRDLGVKGKIKIPPEPIDTSKLSFDDNHVNKEREHEITAEEAKQFIEEANVSFERWGGTFINNYSNAGASYVRKSDNVIRTAYSKEEYTGDAVIIEEVLKKHGRWK